MRKSPVRRWPTWPLILIIVGASAQAGELNFGSPVISGEVAKFEDGRETSDVRKLSRGQLQALTLWLGLHRSAWRGISTPASNARRLLRLNLKDAEGKSASLDAIVRAEGGVCLHLMSSDTWSYKSFGGLVKAAVATQPLSNDEWALLEKILGETS